MAATSQQSTLDFSSLTIRSYEEVLGLVQNDNKLYGNQATTRTPPDDISLVLEQELVNLLQVLLYNNPQPTSITYLNIHLTKDKIGMIDYQFLKKNQKLFAVLVIGEDLKIMLRDVSKHSAIPTAHSKFATYSAHLTKDLYKVNDIIKSGFIELEVEAFYSKFKSNKYNIGLAFLVRNSHAFQLVTCNNHVLVRCRSSLETSSDVISEEDTLNAVEKHSFKSFLAERVAGLLRMFGSIMSQGSLQQCFNFGSCKFDRKFWKEFQNMFSLNGTNIELLVIPSTDDTKSLPAVDYMKPLPGDTDVMTDPVRSRQMPTGLNPNFGVMSDKSFSSHSKALQTSDQSPVHKSAKSTVQKTCVSEDQAPISPVDFAVERTLVIDNSSIGDKSKAKDTISITTHGDVEASKEISKTSSNRRDIGTNTTKQSEVSEVLDKSKSVLVINFDLTPTVEIAECMNSSDSCKALVAAREAIDMKIYEMRDTKIRDLQLRKEK